MVGDGELADEVGEEEKSTGDMVVVGLRYMFVVDVALTASDGNDG